MSKYKQNNRLRRKAETTGWMVGISVLSISIDKAHMALQKAGLTVYRDKSCIFGPSKETMQVISILASTGDALSQQIQRENNAPPQ